MVVPMEQWASQPIQDKSADLSVVMLSDHNEKYSDRMERSYKAFAVTFELRFPFPLTLISNCSWIKLIELNINKFNNGSKINICWYQWIYHIKLYTWTIDYCHSIVEILSSLKYPFLGTIWGGKLGLSIEHNNSDFGGRGHSSLFKSQ